MVVESTVLAMGDGPVVFGNRRASRSHWPNETVPRFTSTEIVFFWLVLFDAPFGVIALDQL